MTYRNQDEKLNLIALYQNERYGLKRLSQLFGVTPRAIKKRLLAAGVYRSAPKEQPQTLWPGPLGNIAAWQTEGEAKVRLDGNTVVLYLPNAFAVASCALLGMGRRKIHVFARIVPIGSSFGCVRFGLREGHQEAAATALLHGNVVLIPVWTVSLDCRKSARIFFRGGACLGVSEFRIMDLWVS